MTPEASDAWVAYSPNESATGDSAGFWSNEFGWVRFNQATCFSAEESGSLLLPIPAGGDARFVPWRQARRHSG